MQTLLRKIRAGEVPVTAQIRAENTEPSSMQIGKIVVSHAGEKRVLSDEMLTLTTNLVAGDKTQKSVASVSLPMDGSIGSISTVGNATVSSRTLPLSLRLAGDSKKLKTSSPSGAYAVVRIRLQRDTGREYFDIIFGIKGQLETVDDAGRKTRPHVTLYPDGNGKFLRLEGEGSGISTKQDYSAASGSIVPTSVEIVSQNFPEILVAEFNSSGGVVELASIKFGLKPE